MQTKIDVRFKNDRSVTVYSEDDVEDYLEWNKVLRGQRQDPKSDLRHVASIPPVIYVQWLNEEWARGNTKLKAFSKEMDEIVAKKLNDPDWAFLRVDGPQMRTGWRA